MDHAVTDFIGKIDTLNNQASREFVLNDCTIDIKIPAVARSPRGVLGNPSSEMLDMTQNRNTG